MRTHLKFPCLFALVASVVGVTAQAQQAGSADARLPAPTIFPAPGTYFNTTSLSLTDAVPGTEIHYTWDGSEPNAGSPAFDPHGVLFIAGLYDGNKGLKTGYTLRAVAMKAGMQASEPVTFTYQIERRDRTVYVSEEVAPGVRMIRDSDNDKMFLIRGTKSYALIDSGMGRGALRDYISQFTGGLPLVAIWTHSHGDHIGQADQFIAGSKEYVGEADRQAVADFLERHGASRAQITEHLESVGDGSKIDLGDRALEIVTVPGHTPGSIVVFDPAGGNLFTGDTFGNNSYLPPDVLWMQWPNQPPLDRYFAAVRTARAMLGNRVKLIMTGHNDHPLTGTKYLDNLETALQRAMDEGSAALIPSYRPPGLKQIVVGDRFTDPNWFGVNINAQTFLPAPPDQIASLTSIDVKGASLTERFASTVHDYRAFVPRDSHGPITISIRPASSRARSLTIDGQPARSGSPYEVSFKGKPKTVPIVITAQDGKTTDTYRLTLSD
jgi:glyoxylase-like metal-dependent hydrolase (beta-lactamase superfamily II)